jgi:predicted enzyme related to lactoylglutathione lyase
LVVCNDARMSSLVGSITFDCARPYELAQFWTEVVGFPIDADSKPDDEEVALEPPAGHPMLLFIRVPEGKAAKNRIHLDIRPRELTRDAEVERLVGLGARQIDDRRTPEGLGWVVLADPEGNEFCVERGMTERRA